MSGSSNVPPRTLVRCLRHHDQADQDRRGRTQHRGNDKMRRGIRDQRRQQGGVEHQHGAGDAGHAAGHHQEQFAAGELRQIRPDEQRRFHHAEEDVGGGGQPDRAADAERAFQQPGEAAHDRRQDAPVEQQRGQHAHHQHDRQRLECQDEFGARRFQVERQRAAAEIAEHERGARARRRGNRADGVVDGAEGVRDERQFDQRHGGEKGDDEADRGLSQRDRAAVFAKRPCQRQQRQHAERRLQLQHDPRGRRQMVVANADVPRPDRHAGESDNVKLRAEVVRPRDDGLPRPTNGILLAITVMNSTLASSGRLAM